MLDITAPAGLDANRLFVLGAGTMDPDRPASGTAWADRGGSLAAKLMAANAETASIMLDGHEAMPAAIAELVAGLRLRHYRFDKYKTRKASDKTPRDVDGDAACSRTGDGRCGYRRPRAPRSTARCWRAT